MSSGGLQTQHLPYPVARAIRGFEIALDPWRRYEQLLEAGESLITWLGILALAGFAEQGSAPDAVNRWMDSLRSGGVSLGSWLEVAQAAEKEMGLRKWRLGEFEMALRARKGNAGLRGALQAIVSERNDRAHGRGPRSDGELSDRLVRLVPILESASRGAGFLANLPAVIPQRCRYSRRRRNFDITALAFVGAPRLRSHGFRLGTTPRGAERLRATSQ